MTLLMKPRLGTLGSRLLGFGLSLLAHLGAIAGLVWLGDGLSPSEQRRRPPVNEEIEELVLTPKDKIIWYDFRQPLPDVSPMEPDHPHTPQAPRTTTDSVLISTAPAAPPFEQTVLQPDPKPLDHEVKAPNVVGYRPPPKPAPLPPPVAAPTAAALTIDAPQVDTARLAVSPLAAGEPKEIAVAKPLPKKFVPANSLASPAAVDTPVISSAPGIATAPGPNVLNAAIISLRPAEKLEALPPEGTRRGQFGVAGEKGALSPGGSANPSDARLPGIAVRNAPASRPSLGSNASAPELRLADTIFSFSAPLHPSSRRLPREIEARFATRAAYTVVVPKPPLPQYAGDWVIWFAETHPAEGPPPLIRAPMPYLRTGATASTPSSGAAAMVAAILGIDGSLTQLTALSPRNPELADKAVADLSKWRLHPARRRDQAVEVEVVIAFGLN